MDTGLSLYADNKVPKDFLKKKFKWWLPIKALAKNLPNFYICYKAPKDTSDTVPMETFWKKKNIIIDCPTLFYRRIYIISIFDK